MWGMAVGVRHVIVWRGQFRYGKAAEVRLCSVCCCEFSSGMVVQGMAVEVRQVDAGLCTEWRGKPRCDFTR